MTQFNEWCTANKTSVATHSLNLLRAKSPKLAHAVSVVSASLPDFYAAPDRIADLLKRLGRDKAAEFVAAKLPTTPNIQSGDLGEILCNSYILENTNHKLGIKRLRWKDHRNMSMRGEDVLAFALSGDGKKLTVIKAEVKSRSSMAKGVLDEARSALSANEGRPSPHALSFIADRLSEKGEKPLKDAIDDAQLKVGLAPAQITHMLFAFSGNELSELLEKNLKAYVGPISQQYVGLQVKEHQDFIKKVFKAVAL